ncbi:MAG: Uncharacterised protein [Cryomorphaceae bacterium]|nr:MAG: Uncharacterised protein [Cryomorphaceae bacterium]
MIKVVPPTVWRVWTILVHVRIVCCRSVVHTVPPHLRDRILPVGMVKHLICNHSNASRVTAVHELFELIRRTVILVYSHVERRVVAPRRVAFKLRVWHQFNGVHTQTRNVVQGINYRLVVAGSHKVANEQFVDDQLLLRRCLEVGILPLVGRLRGFIQGYVTGSFSCRISR